MSILNAQLHHLEALVRKVPSGVMLEELLKRPEVRQQVENCKKLKLSATQIFAAITKGRTR